MNLIDDFLNQITMYRLVLYYLIFLLLAAFILSAFGLFSFSPIALLASTLFFVGVCYIANKIFSWAFDALTNFESVLITALILSLIVSPLRHIQDVPVLGWMAVWAVASKFIIAAGKKHIFNPAAFGVFLTSVTISGSASWWVGTLSMLPFTLVGFLIVRKIRRFSLVIYFFLAAFLSITTLTIIRGPTTPHLLVRILGDTPIIFFATVMLTEPLTTPPKKILQAFYGVLVGVLFAPQLRIASFSASPETALLIGNTFSYFVSPKFALILKILEKKEAGKDIVDFIFKPEKKINFTPGQYMEWTLPHKEADSRGNRRYFTIASSPTEESLRIGVKFEENGSSFKKALAVLNNDTPIGAGQLIGDFVMPQDPSKKLVFMAGGVGVTPFRSMVKYLIDKGQRRDIVLFYSNKTADEVVYRDVFDQGQEVGVKTVYTLTDKESAPRTWNGWIGRVSEEMLRSEVPDWQERSYYLSGPRTMVDAFRNLLKKMGISGNKIITDYFPGFA